MDKLYQIAGIYPENKHLIKTPYNKMYNLEGMYNFFDNSKIFLRTLHGVGTQEIKYFTMRGYQHVALCQTISAMASQPALAHA